MHSYKSIKSYISSLPIEEQGMLNEIYDIIRDEAPMAVQTIKYGMPTFVGRQNLVHFSFNKKHIGFYISPAAIIYFKSELHTLGYVSTKSAIQFPLHMKLPRALLTKIVRFCVNEDSLLKDKKKKNRVKGTVAVIL